MKTMLGAKIFELQRYFGKMKLWKLFLQRKETAKFVGCELFVKMSDCSEYAIFLERWLDE